jgi:hypothetical protein
MIDDFLFGQVPLIIEELARGGGGGSGGGGSGGGSGGGGSGGGSGGGGGGAGIFYVVGLVRSNAHPRCIPTKTLF